MDATCFSEMSIGFLYSSACYLLLAGFLFGLYFYPDDRNDVFLRNVSWLSADYSKSYPRRYNSSHPSLSRSYIVNLDPMSHTQFQQEWKYVTARIKELVKVLKGRVDEWRGNRQSGDPILWQLGGTDDDYYFLLLLSGVGLTSPGTAATSGLLYSPRW
jgi:hypothetical protein